MKLIQVHLVIKGDVTGVGYRAWLRSLARKNRIDGWVRNAEPGVVEAVLKGNERDVKVLIEICRKGPEAGWVESVDVQQETSDQDLNGFDIRL